MDFCSLNLINFTFKKNYASKYCENQVKIPTKITHLSIKKSCFFKLYMMFYIIRIRAFPLHNKQNGLSPCYFFHNQAKTTRKYGKIHTHLIHLNGRNLMIIGNDNNKQFIFRHVCPYNIKRYTLYTMLKTVMVHQENQYKFYNHTLCKKASNHHANLPLEMYSFTL